MKDNFLKGIIQENPVFVSLLALCPLLAMTSSVEAAIGMSVLTMIALILSNAAISLFSPFIPKEIRIPAYIVIIASLVTIIAMLTEAFLPELHSTLGLFIGLIVTNCIVLGRAEVFARKNKVLPSIIDALGMGLGLVLAFFVVGFFRELLGTGGFTFGIILPLPELSWTPLNNWSIPLFNQGPGAFLTFGLILASLTYYSNSKKAKKETLAKVAKETEKKEAK